MNSQIPSVELNRMIRESTCYCAASKSEVNPKSHAARKDGPPCYFVKMTDVLYLTTLRSSGATLPARVTYTLTQVILLRIYISRIFPRCSEEVQSPRGETRDMY